MLSNYTVTILLCTAVVIIINPVRKIKTDEPSSKTSKTSPRSGEIQGCECTIVEIKIKYHDVAVLAF